MFVQYRLAGSSTLMAVAAEVLASALATSGAKFVHEIACVPEGPIGSSDQPDMSTERRRRVAEHVRSAFVDAGLDPARLVRPKVKTDAETAQMASPTRLTLRCWTRHDRLGAFAAARSILLPPEPVGLVETFVGVGCLDLPAGAAWSIATSDAPVSGLVWHDGPAQWWVELQASRFSSLALAVCDEARLDERYTSLRAVARQLAPYVECAQIDRFGPGGFLFSDPMRGRWDTPFLLPRVGACQVVGPRHLARVDASAVAVEDLGGDRYEVCLTEEIADVEPIEGGSPARRRLRGEGAVRCVELTLDELIAERKLADLARII